MLLSGHHSTSGYKRYDRTESLKMEAAALVSANPKLDYQKALTYESPSMSGPKVMGITLHPKKLTHR
ncbi:unnamed protein product [Calypogeia fissa]